MDGNRLGERRGRWDRRGGQTRQPEGRTGGGKEWLLAAGEKVAGGEGRLMGVMRIVAAVGSVIVLGRYVTRPVMRIIAKTGLREVFTGFALLLIAGIALIMSAAGLSVALGAFLPGPLPGRPVRRPAPGRHAAAVGTALPT